MCPVPPFTLLNGAVGTDVLADVLLRCAWNALLHGAIPAEVSETGLGNNFNHVCCIRVTPWPRFIDALSRRQAMSWISQVHVHFFACVA